MMKVEKHFDKITKALACRIHDVLYAGATDIADAARAAAPVDTGSLQASIRAERTASGARVIADDPAAITQEYGTGRHGDQPFMRPAVERLALPILNRVERRVKNIIKTTK